MKFHKRGSIQAYFTELMIRSQRMMTSDCTLLVKKRHFVMAHITARHQVPLVHSGTKYYPPSYSEYLISRLLLTVESGALRPREVTIYQQYFRGNDF
jgi:hypothetical protein